MYEYTVLPFGLANALETFQQLIDHVIAEKIDVFAMVYLDDVLVFSKNEQDHAEHLHWVLTKLCVHKLKAKCTKTAFGLAELQYLGQIIKISIISIDP